MSAARKLKSIKYKWRARGRREGFTYSRRYNLPFATSLFPFRAISCISRGAATKYVPGMPPSLVRYTRDTAAAPQRLRRRKKGYARCCYVRRAGGSRLRHIKRHMVVPLTVAYRVSWWPLRLWSPHRHSWSVSHLALTAD